MVVTVIGIGLIGGSLAQDIRKNGFASKVIGVDNNQNHAAIAKIHHLVDEILDLDDAIIESDLIVVATPIDKIHVLLPYILDKIQGTNTYVIDVGSTKAGTAKLVLNHPARQQYIATHPMAGTEYSGPLAATTNLFDCKSAILCDVELSDKAGVELVKQMYESLNMRLIFMNSSEHDMSAAYVSHISHLSSFALSLCVLEKERNEKQILSLASGGFASTVRLAKSNADTWVPIFQQNATYIMEALDTYIGLLEQFKTHIASNNKSEVARLINESNQIKKILDE